jgi:hypothetical protein
LDASWQRLTTTNAGANDDWGNYVADDWQDDAADSTAVAVEKAAQRGPLCMPEGTIWTTTEVNP